MNIVNKYLTQRCAGEFRKRIVQHSTSECPTEASAITTTGGRFRCPVRQHIKVFFTTIAEFSLLFLRLAMMPQPSQKNRGAS